MLPVSEIAEGGTRVDYNLVPWCSWEEWRFVKTNIFSSSSKAVSAALTRISTWQIRGCLPCAVEVTGALVGVQQNDPFFRKDLSEGSGNSEEMLAMAYNMAIMRLVNGFTEKLCKRRGLSIFEAAEETGIPRMLVDIRHECAHRELPSLVLVRLACTKALDWLKVHYWESQDKYVPDVRKQVEDRLQELALYVDLKPELHAGSLQVKQNGSKCIDLVSARKRCFAQMSRAYSYSKAGGCKRYIRKIKRGLVRLYTLFPSEVVAVMLEFLSKSIVELGEAETVKRCPDSHTEKDTFHLADGISNIWQAVALKISSKKPLFLLEMIEAILRKIANSEIAVFQRGVCSDSLVHHRATLHRQEQLSLVVLWLSQRLNKHFQSACMAPAQDRSFDKLKLKQLISDCICIFPANTHLMDSAVLLSEMSGQSILAEKLQKLSKHGLLDLSFRSENFDVVDFENILEEHDKSLMQTAEKLEEIRFQRRMGNVGAAINVDNGEKPWKVANSWSSCPIGMLPPFGSSKLLPVHEEAEALTNDSTFDDHASGDGYLSEHENCNDLQVGDAAIVKEQEQANSKVLCHSSVYTSQSLVGGQLLIDGIWRKPGEDELLAIESNIRLLV